MVRRLARDLDDGAFRTVAAERFAEHAPPAPSRCSSDHAGLPLRGDRKTPAFEHRFGSGLHAQSFSWLCQQGHLALLEDAREAGDVLQQRIYLALGKGWKG
jgi:hypothetical protein